MRRGFLIALACVVAFGSAVAAMVDLSEVRTAMWTRSAAAQISEETLKAEVHCGEGSRRAPSGAVRRGEEYLAWQAWYQDLRWPCGEADLAARLSDALSDQPARWLWSEGRCVEPTARQCLRRLAAGRVVHRGKVVRALAQHPPPEAMWPLVDALELGDLLDPDLRDRRAVEREPLEALSEVLERVVTLEEGAERQGALARFHDRVRTLDVEGAPDAVHAAWRRVERRCAAGYDRACGAGLVAFSQVLAADDWPPEDGEGSATTEAVSPWLDRVADHCGGAFARGLEGRLLRWSAWSTDDGDPALVAGRLVGEAALRPMVQQLLIEPEHPVPEPALEAISRRCDPVI